MKVKDKYELRGRQGIIGANYEQVHICIEENVVAYINGLLNDAHCDNENFVKRFSIDEKILREKIEKNSQNTVLKARSKMDEELQEIVISQIRKSILSKYNMDIDDYLMSLYAFWKLYQECLNELNNFIQTKMIIEPNQKQIIELINRRKNTLVDNDGENAQIQTFEECESISFKKLHEEFSKLISKNNKELEGAQIEEIEKTIFSDAIYLGLFSKDALTTNLSFFSEWAFYPVTEVFHDIISELETSSEENYREFRDNEKKYFDCLCACAVEFDSINRKKVETDGKKRSVYYVQDEFDKIVVRYLQKRLNIIFRVKYPNRDLIMEKCIRLIDSLPDLEDYTIYRFDFESFFESVNCEAFFKRYVEPSRMKRFEKELLRKLIDKSPSVVMKKNKNYKGCLQGIGTSNAITEIVAREFDSRVRSCFIDSGLICYERFVDDGILIFNRLVDKEKIVQILERCMNEVFGEQMTFQTAKTIYQTKTGNRTDSEFDFLGYDIFIFVNQQELVDTIISLFAEEAERFHLRINADKLEKGNLPKIWFPWKQEIVTVKQYIIDTIYNNRKDGHQIEINRKMLPNMKQFHQNLVAKFWNDRTQITSYVLKIFYNKFKDSKRSIFNSKNIDQDCAELVEILFSFYCYAPSYYNTKVLLSVLNFLKSEVSDSIFKESIEKAIWKQQAIFFKANMEDILDFIVFLTAYKVELPRLVEDRMEEIIANKGNPLLYAVWLLYTGYDKVYETKFAEKIETCITEALGRMYDSKNYFMYNEVWWIYIFLDCPKISSSCKEEMKKKMRLVTSGRTAAEEVAFLDGKMKDYSEGCKYLVAKFMLKEWQVIMTPNLTWQKLKGTK